MLALACRQRWIGGLVVNFESRRRVRTTVLLTPRGWQEVSYLCRGRSDECRRLGDYESAESWYRASRGFDPADDYTHGLGANVVNSSSSTTNAA